MADHSAQGVGRWHTCCHEVEEGVCSATAVCQGTAHQGVDAAEAAALHARVIVRDLSREVPAELRGALRAVRQRPESGREPLTIRSR